LAGLWVNSGQVRALPQIAAMARERQVIVFIGAAMLLCNDVLDVMPQFAVDLAQAAIFAPLAGTAADEIPSGCIHLLLDRRVKPLASLELEDGNEVRCIDQRLVFGAFAIAECPLISPLSERVDPFLHWRVNLQIDDTTRRLHVETPAQR